MVVELVEVDLVVLVDWVVELLVVVELVEVEVDWVVLVDWLVVVEEVEVDWVVLVDWLVEDEVEID